MNKKAAAQNIEPIAYIKTDYKEKFGIPRQSGRAPSSIGRIVFEPKYRDPDAVRGIEGFSHLWLIFDFSESHRDTWSATVRPPRLGGNKRIGVFASRSPFRPNPLGLSCVKFEGLSKEGDIIVSGADLLDETPIFDIKPYLPFADSKPDALGGYAAEFANYRLKLDFPEKLKNLIPQDKCEALSESLCQDPRPSYQNDSERIYSMRFADFDISFKISGDTLFVVGVKEC